MIYSKQKGILNNNDDKGLFLLCGVLSLISIDPLREAIIEKDLSKNYLDFLYLILNSPKIKNFATQILLEFEGNYYFLFKSLKRISISENELLIKQYLSKFRYFYCYYVEKPYYADIYPCYSYSEINMIAFNFLFLVVG